MNHIKGVLHNLSGSEFPKFSYGRGVFLGVVSTVMQERGIGWDEAMRSVVPLLPDDYREQCIPPGWLDEVKRIKS